VTAAELPTYIEDGRRRVIPPFDLLDAVAWGPMPLAVGPRVELSVVLDDTAAGAILVSVVILVGDERLRGPHADGPRRRGEPPPVGPDRRGGPRPQLTG
jgi:hypothetical protein